ncbi:MAG: EAL domain-containing protein [Elusimicrobiaceae bacterium]|nr:EAL domain-containing protein [Elusimicrobiaceae bacterium]
MNNSSKNLFSITLVVLSVAVLVVTGGLFFSFSLRNVLLNQQKVYLQEVTKRAASDFTGYLEREMQALKAISSVFSDFYSYSSLDEYLTILDKLAKSYVFKDIGLFFVNSKTAYFENGEVKEDFLSQDIINEVLNGKSVISNLSYDPFTKQPIIIYATPFLVNDRVEAILFATQRIEEFQKVLAKYKISGEGFTAVLNRKDQLIVDTSRDSFKPQDLQELLAFHGKEGLMLYNNLLAALNNSDGASVVSYITEKTKEQKLISFEKISVLGLEDWHLIFVVPSKVISILQKKIFLGSLVFCFALLLSFAVILVFIEKREHEQRREIFNVAFKDEVTGGYNMARFRSEISEILKAKPDQKFALVLLDIDKFKVINDLYGFRQGDLVLNHVANVLADNTDISKGEIFARLIGDIFSVLINYQEDKDITNRLDKIYKAVQNCYAVTDMHYSINTVFGIYKIDTDLPFYLMLDRASLAKKIGKESINKRYVFYDDQALKNVLQDKEIENGMYRAMKNDEFHLYFHPKCSFSQESICGAEVLTRWQNVKLGALSPEQFIPIFERTGLIIKLDFYILELVLKTLRNWLDEGIKPCKLSINFSRLHLKDDLSLPKIKILLDMYKVPTEFLEIEITEGSVMNNTTEAKKFIDGLHELGISVAMDDFGAGYSSLNLLKDLPFDTFKIDKEFLQDFDTNPRTSSVLEGIVSMLKNMKTGIVVEGVETLEQAAFLTSLQCDLAQGFLYYKPMPEEEFKNLINKKG